MPCLSDSGRGRHCKSATSASTSTAPEHETRSWQRYNTKLMPLARWTGRCRRTPRSAGRITTAPLRRGAPARRASYTQRARPTHKIGVIAGLVMLTGPAITPSAGFAADRQPAQPIPRTSPRRNLPQYLIGVPARLAAHKDKLSCTCPSTGPGNTPSPPCTPPPSGYHRLNRPFPQPPALTGSTGKALTPQLLGQPAVPAHPQPENKIHHHS